MTFQQALCHGGLGLMLLSLAGCAAPSSIADGLPSGKPCAGFALSDLAGEWEVEEGGIVVPLTVDVLGFGTYKWQQGSLETLSFDGTVWRGNWHQPGNDRDGGFEVRLSPDGASAEGRSWYLRIGDEHLAENAKGGSIKLMRALTTPGSHKPCTP